MKALTLQKSHLLLAVLWVAVTPWFFGGRRPVALIITALALLLGAFMVWRSPEPKAIGRGVVPLAYLGLLAWGGLSLIWSASRFDTAVWLVHMAMAGLVFVSAYQLRDAEWRKRWLGGYVVLATIFSIWGIWLFVTTSYERLTSSFYWANPWAIWVLPAVFISFWYWCERGKKIYLIPAALSGAAFWLADSRSSFLLLVMVALGLMFSLRRKREFWLRLLLAVGLVLLTASAVREIRERRGSSTPSPGARLAELTGDSSNRSDRLFFLRSTFEIWKDHPLGGTGAGTFGSIHPQYQFRVISASEHAHNFYAQTLSELGLVGFILLAILVLSLLKAAWASYASNRGKLVAVILTLLLIHLALDVDSAYPAILLLVAAFAGLNHSPAAYTKRAAYPVWTAAAALLLCLPVGSYYLSDLARRDGLAWQEEGEHIKAAERLRDAHMHLMYDPDSVTEEGINRYALGLLSRSARELELKLALERAEKAAKLDPKDGQHHLLKARILRLAGQHEAAEAAYNQAIALDPYNDPEYYTDLASMYISKERHADAHRVLSQLTELYPEAVVYNRERRPGLRNTMSFAYAQRGSLNLMRGEVEQAKNDLTLASKLNPSNQLAQKLLQEIGPR